MTTVENGDVGGNDGSGDEGGVVKGEESTCGSGDGGGVIISARDSYDGPGDEGGVVKGEESTSGDGGSMIRVTSDPDEPAPKG